jgi:hypothetical protein
VRPPTPPAIFPTRHDTRVPTLTLTPPSLSPGVRALPALTSDPDAIVDAPSVPEDDPADDAGLRWGVAGVVSVIPAFGFLAWLLPAMAEDPPAANPDRSDASTPPAVAASARTRYLACAALYAVAYAAHGFDPSDAAVWAATAANAANLQLERVFAEAEDASSRRALAASSSNLRKPSKKRIEKTSKRFAEADAARGEGAGAGDWAGGEDPLPLLPFRAMDVRLPEGLPSLPSVRAPEVPEITVESVGRAIGATQIAAARLREEVEEGKIRAVIERDARAESERLERERAFAAEEIHAWDERFELRTMTRDGLLAIARERGMRGYSKLRRGELLEAVEREIYGDEEAGGEDDEKRRER